MRRLFACLSLTTVASTAFATTAADDFGARRWPAQPMLGLNREPNLCKSVLADAIEDFVSVDIDLDLAAAVAKDFPPLAAKPALDVAADEMPPVLRRLDLDLDGTGQQQVVIFRDVPFNWQGDWHYAYVFPSAAAFDAARPEIATMWSTVPQDSQYPSPGARDHSAQQYYPAH